MKTISLIAAANPGLWNAGMLTVDLAFADLVEAAEVDAKIRWWVPYAGDMVAVRPRPYVSGDRLPFSFEVLAPNDNQFLASDAIVCWGDFLQARHYITGEAATRLVDAGICRTHDAAVAELCRTLLLADADRDTRRRVMISGSTILHNRESDYSDPVYGPAFRSLIVDAHTVMMRDPVSASKIAHLRGGGVDAKQGCDSALLLRDEAIQRLRTSEWLDGINDRSVVGVFMGRRTELDAAAALDFAGALGRACGSKLDWLPWFGWDYPRYVSARDSLTSPTSWLAYRRDRARAESMMRVSDTVTAGDLLQALRRYRFVITDTYHVCVNSWRAGTPAVCIASSKPLSGTDYQSLSLADLKKTLLYGMYDASDFYVESDDIHDPERRRVAIDRLGAALGDPVVSNGVSSRVKAHADAVRRTVTKALRDLLSR